MNLETSHCHCSRDVEDEHSQLEFQIVSAYFSPDSFYRETKLNLRSRLSGEPSLQTKPWRNLRTQGPGPLPKSSSMT